LLASVAVTVLPPGEPEGTVKDAENDPAPETMIGDGEVATEVPANVSVTVELGKKFEPDNVTDEF